MSSRQPTVSRTEAVPLTIRSRALPSHTSVPWEKPDRRTRVLKSLGWVSTSMPRVNRVLNSGMATAPVGPNSSSFSKPRTLEEVKMLMVSGSSRGMARALTPVRSSSIRIMVGSSWPSMSSFSRLSSMQWYSKWVVMVSASSASAGCCTAVKSSTSMSSGTTTRPPGCWPVVRRTPTQPWVRRFTSALPAVRPRSSRYLRTKPKAVFSARVPMVPARNTWVWPNISMAWRWARAWYSPEKFRSISGTLPPP